MKFIDSVKERGKKLMLGKKTDISNYVNFLITLFVSDQCNFKFIVCKTDRAVLTFILPARQICLGSVNNDRTRHI